MLLVSKNHNDRCINEMQRFLNCNSNSLCICFEVFWVHCRFGFHHTVLQKHINSMYMFTYMTILFKCRILIIKKIGKLCCVRNRYLEKCIEYIYHIPSWKELWYAITYRITINDSWSINRKLGKFHVNSE